MWLKVLVAVFGMEDLIKICAWLLVAMCSVVLVFGVVVLVGVDEVAEKVGAGVEEVVQMVWPLLTQGRKTQSFGNYNPDLYPGIKHHTGIDVAIPMGSVVRVVLPGRVVNTYSGTTGYGSSVWVQHAGGLMTVYGHLSRINVTAGDEVKLGQKVGLSGNSGHSTGPHLHFEVRLNGGLVDPERYLP